MAKRDFKTIKLGPDEYVVYVALNDGREVVLDKESMDFLLRIGLSSNWSANTSDIVSTSGRLSSNNHVSVARVIADAGPNEIVCYRDNNKMNLRRDNLYIKSGKASKRDRLYV